MLRRRRTDQLPARDADARSAIRDAQPLCDGVTSSGFEAAIVVHVPDDGGNGMVCAGSGRVEPFVELGRGIAHRVVREHRALCTEDAPASARTPGRRTAAMPIGRTASGTAVLVVDDGRLARREAMALAAWSAPAREASSLASHEGPYADLIGGLARDTDAAVIAIALFAQSGMVLNLHLRSGAIIQSSRVPTDTVWGEVARHGAAFTLGDLSLHAGAALLGSLGMHSAGLVGLENGRGLPVGALGIASAAELDLDVSHRLLALAPSLGPELMRRLSSTAVPVPDEHGSVDVGVLAARVGCQRFAMYERDGTELRLVAAHTSDGTREMSAPDAVEQILVHRAAEHGVGTAGDDSAAVLIGSDTILYAHDPSRRALDRLRLALADVRKSPWGAESGDLDADAA